MQNTHLSRLVLSLPLAAATVASAQLQWTAIRLHPDGQPGASKANAARGDRQGGTLSDNIGLGHATIWRGSADSALRLTPSWAQGSFLNGMHRDTQGGQVFLGNQIYHAATWNGTPESAVDLHPSDSYRASDIRAVRGGTPGAMPTALRGHDQHLQSWPR